MNKRMVKRLKKSLQKNKLTLGISVIVVIAIIIGSIALINFQFSKASIDTSKLLENQTVENIEFVNASMTDNKLKIVVHNRNRSIYNLKTIDVVFKDSSNQEIETVNAYIGNSLKEGEYKQLVIDTDADLSTASSIQYRINK